MITDTFEVKEEHIKLIQGMYINYSDWAEFGAPVVDPKRPYGNSDVYRDIAEILEIPLPDFEEDEWFTDEQQEFMLNLHKETTKALQILAQHLKLEIGKYEQEMYHRWDKVD